ncbi:hypothetical protein [Mycobacteroides salmoniphilum]|uniref:Uncharacterized protein n=1 Tax=Mycobacteroides salmoniphilum TaxID=404941 RepID=A0A4R8T1G7_9MYCO|nr:hypothetical protein [Mycobacteroides salmoniphilum]TEA09228.1 hypothetical protein CCUG60884_00218 [Mycobacteroides salmoniphilum]
MMVYTPIRWVERVMGRGTRGGKLLLGPFNYKRELPILLPGVFISLSILLTEFPIIGAMFTAGPSLVRIIGALLIAIIATVILLATLIAVAWRRNSPKWPPQKVLTRSRINQWRRRPVYVSGRDQLARASVVAGGKVRVRT